MSRKSKPRRHEPEVADEAADRGPGERLQKVLAAAGLGSRRDCEDLIREGRVEIDGKIVTELGTRVDPLRQEIRVDTEPLKRPQRQYFAVNKPIGVVTTNFDPARRPRVIDLVPTEERVFAVGRLDRSSEGLILVTNDGEFANRVTHPRYGVEKTYLVRVAGAPDQRQLARLKKGVHLAEGFARAQSIFVKRKHGQSTDLVIVLSEGRNREVRRILARVGHKVLALKRIAVGPIKLGDLPVGGWRRLADREVEAVLHVARQKRREAKGKAQARSASEGIGRPTAGSTKRSPDVGEYVQKESLLAEPLSLDDLLRDDLDEGPVTAEIAAPGVEEPGEFSEAETAPGGVIDYEDEFSEAPPQPEPRRRDDAPPRGKGKMRGKPRPGKRGRFQKGRGQGGRPAEMEALPREDFGRKRGGKRALGPPHEGRGPTGEKAGKFRFRPKRKKKVGAAQGGPQEGRRRGGGRGQTKKFGKSGSQQKRFGKTGGKRKGRR